MNTDSYFNLKSGAANRDLTPWRNGGASDSRSEGCVFESRRGELLLLFILAIWILKGIQRRRNRSEKVKERSENKM